MRTRLTNVLHTLRPAPGAHREPAQILVLFAIFVIVLLVLSGSAYDYASIVVDDARLQNAVDAAALAGSNALSANAAKPVGTPVAIASATTGAYLQRNGVNANATVTMAFPTSTPPPSRAHFWVVSLDSECVEHLCDLHGAEHLRPAGAEDRCRPLRWDPMPVRPVRQRQPGLCE